jgi:hypothetical protein
MVEDSVVSTKADFVKHLHKKTMEYLNLREAKYEGILHFSFFCCICFSDLHRDDLKVVISGLSHSSESGPISPVFDIPEVVVPRNINEIPNNEV